MSQRFEHHARTVMLLTAVSRVSGLARDAVLSRIFGAGALTDAFFFGFMIPNLFRRLFGEGALAAAFLPVYTQLDRDDPATARKLASLTVALLVTFLGAFVLIAEIVLFFVSQRANHENLAIWLTMLMLPYMPMVCLVAILGAMLQVHHRFGPNAASPIVLNGCIILAATFAPFVLVGGFTLEMSEEQRLAHIGITSCAVLCAGVLQIIWMLHALRSAKWWTRDLAAARAPMKRVLHQVLPMLLGLGVLQLNTFFDGIIASYPTAFGSTIFSVEYPLEEGAMATISFAQRLYQFPLGVFGIAVATAIFPLLSRQTNDDEAFRATIRRALRLVIFIGLPASAGLMLVREPLTTVILRGGDFSAENAQRVARVLLGYAPAVWAYSMTHVLTRAFYARGDSKTPVKIAVTMVALNLALNCTLIWTPLKEAGLAWSTASCATIQAVVLAMILRNRIGALIDRDVARSWMKSIAAAILMSAIVAVMMYALPSDAGESWSSALVGLLSFVALGLVAYVSCALAFRMPELRWALGKADRKD